MPGVSVKETMSKFYLKPLLLLHPCLLACLKDPNTNLDQNPVPECSTPDTWPVETKSRLTWNRCWSRIFLWNNPLANRRQTKNMLAMIVKPVLSSWKMPSICLSLLDKQNDRFPVKPTQGEVDHILNLPLHLLKVPGKKRENSPVLIDSL